MNYLTQYYKNLSEQLQEQVNYLERLLEGQEEVDAAIKTYDDALNRQRKIEKASIRLASIIKTVTKSKLPASENYRFINTRKKIDKTIKPILKKTFHNLSPEDRMQFLLSPYSSVDERDKDYFVGKTMYDKLVGLGGHESMFPLKDFRDAEDILSVVRSTPVERAWHSKDRNMADSKKRPAYVYDRSDEGLKDVVRDGTFHERKKLRKSIG